MACQPLKFLTDQQVADIHEKLMARDGGLAGYREGAQLTVVLDRIRNQIRFGGDGAVSVELIAAMTTFALTIGAPFNDGNRRTALACGLVVLKVNGCAADAEPVRLLRLIAAAASGDIDQEPFTNAYLALLAD